MHFYPTNGKTNMANRISCKRVVAAKTWLLTLASLLLATVPPSYSSDVQRLGSAATQGDQTLSAGADADRTQRPVSTLFEKFVSLTRTDDCEQALSVLVKLRHETATADGKAQIDELINSCRALNDEMSQYKLAWAHYFKMPVPRSPAGQSKKVTVASDSKYASLKGSGIRQLIEARGVTRTQIEVMDRHHQKSIECFDSFLRQHPQDVWAASYRAYVQAEWTGDFHSAITLWQSIARNHPSCQLPKRFLEMLKLRCGTDAVDSNG